MTDTGFAPHTPRTDWWSRRPRRSRSDSKVAGVAGGLAHHLGVDPVLFRVGFVALIIVGGVGILAYCLLWLLLPAEGDEVSAGEALIGRGRSSVSPLVAAVLAVAVLLSITAGIDWGMPFWPALVFGLVTLHIARKRGRGPFRPGSEWERRIRSTAGDVGANRWSTGQETAGPQGWGCSPTWDTAAPTDRHGSPFDGPAFWDQPSAGDTPTTSTPGDPFRKADPGTAGDASRPGPAATAAGREPRTGPPAWDPLGAAPFAWDLPDIDIAPPSDVATTRTRTGSPVIARATLGVAVLAVAVQVLGLLAGWWAPAWAVIGATALTIVGIGVLAQALRGRRLTLVGPGVLLSAATLILTMTGISGNPTFGSQTWIVDNGTPLVSEYRLSAGDGVLDLRGLIVPAGKTVTTSLDVKAGQARVVVPADVAVNVTCSSNAGQIDCLGVMLDGLDSSTTATQGGKPTTGTLDLVVHVGAGNLIVEVGR
ncbi:MAG: PspC domain-containing protein [Nakamurella sp.]